MFRWIQIALEEAALLEEQGMIPRQSRFHYKDESTGIDMVKYHVDACKVFLEKMKQETEFGGNLSVRFPDNNKPLIVFGHDECIFKQYTLTKKSWVGPNGKSVLVPKDEGQGVMISAFQSREFGFGVDLMEEQVAVINMAH